MKLRLGIVGGDERHAMLAKSLTDDGNEVKVTGFENYDGELTLENVGLDELLENSDCIILPIPVSRDGSKFNMPYSSKKVKINSDLAARLQGKKIFCYDSAALTKICGSFQNCLLHDFSQREDFLIKNAILTAEGAIDIATKNCVKPLYSARCLICGFGRIGKALAPRLKKLGTTVSISARKINDMLKIKLLNCRAILTAEIGQTSGYDVIFNTVPSVIFNKSVLEKSAQGALIIDLASPPGGIDRAAAEKLGITVIHALGVPGKMSPKASGEVIKDTIYSMLNKNID